MFIIASDIDKMLLMFNSSCADLTIFIDTTRSDSCCVVSVALFELTNTTFGKFTNMKRSKSLNLEVEMDLNESFVLATLQYRTEKWSLTVTNKKKLEVAYHRWLRRTLDSVNKLETNGNKLKVRKRTRMVK